MWLLEGRWLRSGALALRDDIADVSTAIPLLLPPLLPPAAKVNGCNAEASTFILKDTNSLTSSPSSISC